MWKSKIIILTFLLSSFDIFADKLFDISNSKPIHYVGDEIVFKFYEPHSSKTLFYKYFLSDVWSLLSLPLNSEYATFQVPYVLNDTIFFRLEERSDYSFELLWDSPGIHNSEVRAVFVSNDGSYVITVSSATIQIHAISSRKLISTINFASLPSIYNAVTLRHSLEFMIATENGLLWTDVESAKQETIYVDNSLIRAIKYNPKAEQVLFGTYGGLVGIYDLTSKQIVRSFITSPLDEIYTVAYSPNFDTIAFAGYSGNIYLTDKDLNLISSFGQHGEAGQNTTVFEVNFIPGTNELVSVGVDRTVRLWDLDNGVQVSRLDYHDGHVRSADAMFGSRAIVSTGLDSSIVVYDREYSELAGRINYGAQALWSELRSDTLFVAGRDRGFSMYRIHDRTKEYETVFANVAYRFELNPMKITAKYGNEEDLRVEFKHKYVVDSLPFNKHDLSLWVNYPKDLIYFLDNTNDIFEISTPIELSNVKLANCLMLRGSEHSGKITFDSIQSHNRLYHYFADSTTAEVVPDCYTNQNYGLQVGPFDFEFVVRGSWLEGMFENGETGEFKLRFSNSIGLEYLSDKVYHTQNGKLLFTESLENFSSGVYFLQIISPSGMIYTKKMIIH